MLFLLIKLIDYINLRLSHVFSNSPISSVQTSTSKIIICFNLILKQTKIFVFTHISNKLILTKQMLLSLKI